MVTCRQVETGRRAKVQAQVPDARAEGPNQLQAATSFTSRLGAHFRLVW